MSFQLPVYQMPDFTLPQFVSAPNAAMAPAPRDGVAPEGFHSTGIDPEYFKIDGKWTLAPEIRMDCVPVLRDSGVIDILEFRRLKQGDLVIQGRTRETGFPGIIGRSWSCCSTKSRTAATTTIWTPSTRCAHTAPSPPFWEGEGLTDGIMASCVQTGVPFVLVGSVRDDGPLPEAFHDVYAGQDAMREHVKQATTVIGMATTLHTIATGNLTPSYRVLKDGTVRPVYFYSVDTSDFSANKLADRGSLSAKGIVANAQDFITKVAEGLGL